MDDAASLAEHARRALHYHELRVIRFFSRETIQQLKARYPKAELPKLWYTLGVLIRLGVTPPRYEFSVIVRAVDAVMEAHSSSDMSSLFREEARAIAAEYRGALDLGKYVNRAGPAGTAGTKRIKLDADSHGDADEEDDDGGDDGDDDEIVIEEEEPSVYEEDILVRVGLPAEVVNLVMEELSAEWDRDIVQNAVVALGGRRHQESVRKTVLLPTAVSVREAVELEPSGLKFSSVIIYQESDLISYAHARDVRFNLWHTMVCPHPVQFPAAKTFSLSCTSRKALAILDKLKCESCRVATVYAPWPSEKPGFEVVALPEITRFLESMPDLRDLKTSGTASFLSNLIAGRIESFQAVEFPMHPSIFPPERRFPYLQSLTLNRILSRTRSTFDGANFPALREIALHHAPLGSSFAFTGVFPSLERVEKLGDGEITGLLQQPAVRHATVENVTADMHLPHIRSLGTKDRALYGIVFPGLVNLHHTRENGDLIVYGNLPALVTMKWDHAWSAKSLEEAQREFPKNFPALENFSFYNPYDGPAEIKLPPCPTLKVLSVDSHYDVTIELNADAHRSLRCVLLQNENVSLKVVQEKETRSAGMKHFEGVYLSIEKDDVDEHRKTLFKYALDPKKRREQLKQMPQILKSAIGCATSGIKRPVILPAAFKAFKEVHGAPKEEEDGHFDYLAEFYKNR